MAKWARKYDLRMPLICDTDYAISAAFGVARPMVGVAKRTTFIIEPDGTLSRTYPKVTAKGHAAQVLADVRASEGSADTMSAAKGSRRRR
jgi:thioredoxin-dependent peroxiredoxin